MAGRSRAILLHLVRCGDTSWDREGRLHGATDLPLSNRGRATVTDAAGALEGRRLATVHHAPDEAATETALLIGRAAGAKTKAVEDLRDPDLGLLEGLTGRVFEDRFPKRHKQWLDDPLRLAPPEGELVAEARHRLFAAMERLLRRARGPELAVVLHPVGLGLVRCAMAGQPASRLWSMLEGRPTVERYLVDVGDLAWLRPRLEAAAT